MTDSRMQNRRSARFPVLTNVLASFAIAAGVAVSMVVWGAPTWAWIGIGLFVYLHEVKHGRAA